MAKLLYSNAKYSNVKFANFVNFCITQEKALTHFHIGVTFSVNNTKVYKVRKPYRAILSTF